MEVGDKFNRWTVLSERFKKNSNSYIWFVKCRCDCGTEKDVRTSTLTSPSFPSISCGCYRKEQLVEKKTKPLPIGKKISRLTVLEDLGIISRRRVCLAECECGVVKEYRWDGILTGNVKSCGCYHRDMASLASSTHKMTKTRTHDIWITMKQRCTNPKSEGYELYGGRGIKVCDRWANSFEYFLEDMGECPDGMSIDRINVEGHYEPSNCRWADGTTQIHNQNKRKGNCTSRFKGVSLNASKNKWDCRLQKFGKVIFRKRFSSEIEAAVAYDEASFVHYGDRPNQELIEEILKKENTNASISYSRELQP